MNSFHKTCHSGDGALIIKFRKVKAVKMTCENRSLSHPLMRARDDTCWSCKSSVVR